MYSSLGTFVQAAREEDQTHQGIPPNNQYDIGRTGRALMLSLHKADWDRQADGRADGHKKV